MIKCLNGDHIHWRTIIKQRKGQGGITNMPLPLSVLSCIFNQSEIRDIFASLYRIYAFFTDPILHLCQFQLSQYQLNSVCGKSSNCRDMTVVKVVSQLSLFMFPLAMKWGLLNWVRYNAQQQKINQRLLQQIAKHSLYIHFHLCLWTLG